MVTVPVVARGKDLQVLPAEEQRVLAIEEAWAECFGAIRDAGGNMFLQLWHEGAVRREGGDGPYADAPTLSPSGIRSPGKLQGRGATLEELAKIRDGFAHSALLAKQAGAAGVEVHACHGYLLDLFLWEATNQRTDGYGGPELTARVRFPAEVVAAASSCFDSSPSSRSDALRK